MSSNPVTTAVLIIVGVVLLIGITSGLVYAFISNTLDDAVDEADDEGWKDERPEPDGEETGGDDGTGSVDGEEGEPGDDEDPADDDTEPDDDEDPDDDEEPDEDPDPDDDEEPPELSLPLKPRKWTTFMYVAFDNNLGDMGSWESDLHFLETVGSTDEMNLVALVDQGNVGDSHALYIEKGGSWRASPSEVCPGWGGELNMGDPDVLFGYLQWGIANFPAERYDLHVNNHGGAWMGACSDEYSDDFLHADEMREALLRIKNETGSNLDLLSFDACLMSNLEFAYEIWDCADYLTGCETYGIGSYKQEGRFYAGNWLYDEVWGGLLNNTDWTAREFALHQLDCFQKQGPFTSPRDGIVYSESSDTFAVVSLESISLLVDRVALLAEELLSSISGVAGGQTLAERQLVLSVIGHNEASPDMCTESFSGQLDFVGLATFPLYDLGDFVRRLADGGNLLCSQENATRVAELLDDVVVGFVHGNRSQAGEHPDAHGLSIYIPFRSSEYMEEYENTLFAEDTLWDEFLKKVPWGSF